MERMGGGVSAEIERDEMQIKLVFSPKGEDYSG